MKTIKKHVSVTRVLKIFFKRARFDDFFSDCTNINLNVRNITTTAIQMLNMPQTSSSLSLPNPIYFEKK